MSFTAIYTPLYPLDREAADISPRPHTVGCGVRITDPDGLEEYLPDWGTDMVTNEFTDSREYPAQQWKRLEGFKTWDRDEFNIEREGFYYDREKATDFWSGLSEYTEPFQFMTSPFDGGWLHAMDVATLDGQEIAAMHVVCHSGDIWMHEIPVQAGERRKIE